MRVDSIRVIWGSYAFFLNNTLNLFHQQNTIWDLVLFLSCLYDFIHCICEECCYQLLPFILHFPNRIYQDKPRTDAYQTAILENRQIFKGKTGDTFLMACSILSSFFLEANASLRIRGIKTKEYQEIERCNIKLGYIKMNE